MRTNLSVLTILTLLATPLAGCDDPGDDEPLGSQEDVLHVLPAPLLLAPADGAVLDEARPAFSWKLALCAGLVQVQICVDPACKNVTQSFNSHSRRARPPVDLAAGHYYWRAARVRGARRVSAWSVTRRFEIRLAPVVTQDLFGVWSVGVHDVWVVGAAGTILHFDGAWSAEVSPTTQPLHAVWAESGGRAWAVGAGGTILRRNGTSWTATPSPTTSDLRGVWASGSDDAWAASADGLILHWDGTSWSIDFDRGAGRFEGIWGAAADDVWVVGQGREPDDDYASLLLHWNGSTWSESYVCNPEGTRFASGGWIAVLDDVWGAGGTLWGAGRCGPGASFVPFGYLASDTGSGWGDAAGVAASLYEFRPLSAIWAASASDVWAASSAESSADGDPTMLHFDGTSWTASTQLVTVGIHDLGGTAANDVWAVGRAGKRLHHDGVSWTATP